jgi:glycosyltransferase involved in cell wall biosynthesis/O-antigen/teichoic acid export membrane protein
VETSERRHALTILRRAAVRANGVDVKARRAKRGQIAALLIAIPLTNAANFVFHAAASHVLGPDAYSALNALLAVVLVVAVPVAALQAILTRYFVIGAEAGTRADARPALLRIALVAIGLGLVAVASAPLISAYLHLGSLVPGMWLGVYLAATLIALVPRSLLLADLRFAPIAAAALLTTAIRLAVGIPLLVHGGGIVTALVAASVAELAGSGLLLLAARMEFRLGRADLGVPVGELAGAIATFAGLGVLTGIDLLIARHVLPKDAAGSYAASAMLTRTLLFATSAITAVAYPYFAASDATAAWRARRRSIAAVIALGAAGGVTFLVFRSFVLHQAFGAGYHASVALVVTLTCVACALAVLTIFVSFNVARGRCTPGAVWCGVALVVVLTRVVPETVVAMALATLASVIAAAIPLAGRVMPQVRNEMMRSTSGTTGIDVTIVVPYYNPGPALCRNIRELVETLRAEPVRFEVVAVADGCTDGSDVALRTLDLPELRTVVLERNRGKGEALRTGLDLGRGAYLGFIDADGDLDPHLWHPFLELMSLYEADVISGCKRHPLSEVHYPPLRRIYSWTYQQLVHALFHLRVRDTQTGIKLIRREVLAAVLPRTRERGFAFDLELFVVAERLGYHRFFEAPVMLDHQFRSTISARTTIRVLLDTLAIAYRLRFAHAYDRVDYESIPTTAFAVAFVDRSSGEATL